MTSARLLWQYTHTTEGTAATPLATPEPLKEEEEEEEGTLVFVVAVAVVVVVVVDGAVADEADEDEGGAITPLLWRMGAGD